MKYARSAIAVLVSLGSLSLTGPARSDPNAAEATAAALAATLHTICPQSAYDDQAAFHACGAALRTATLPLAAAVAWGDEQPGKPIRRKSLTEMNHWVFQTLYLPLFAFTGKWTVGENETTHQPILWLQAYFRNALPSGDYPYPFWHSPAKWAAYEAANQLGFYLGPHGGVSIVTRTASGSNAERGVYAHVATPAFTGAGSGTIRTDRRSLPPPSSRRATRRQTHTCPRSMTATGAWRFNYVRTAAWIAIRRQTAPAPND